MSGNVPDTWAVKTVGEIASITMGQSPPSSTVSDDGDGLPFIQGNAEFGARYPKPRQFAADCPKVVEGGDILLSVRAPVGEVNVAPERLCIGRGLAGLRPTDGDHDFLYYALGGLAQVFARLSQGSTFDAINSKDLRSISLTVPSLDEQRRIAEVLRSVDEAIAATDAVISQLQETRGHRLETLMALPGTYRRIDEVCRLSGGFGFPIKHQGKVSGRYPFAKVSDMNRSGNEVQMRHAENYVDEADLRTLRARTFPVGTTFFPKVGATLLTNKRRIAAVEMLVDNNVMGAVATDIDPWFLYYAFCTIDMADYVQPGAVPSVNQRTIGQIMIPVPDRAAQKEFVETMRDLDAAIEMQSGALTQVTATKRALMSDLLSGHVRVPA